MMKWKIGTLTIKRFRAFRELKLESLGRVSLITGRNNTGKSSVLEALRILASGASPSVIYSILNFREEDNGNREEGIRLVDSEGVFPWSSLFNGFPKFSANLEPITVASDDGERPMEITLGATWYSEERMPDGTRRLALQQEDLFSESDSSPALLIKVDGIPRVIPMDSGRRFPYRSRPLSYGVPEESSMPCMFVSAYGGERTATLGPLWDEVALSDYENDVVEALRIVDPSISAVSMVGGEGRRDTRTAIVRSKDLPRPVPLRSFGDGMNRLFGIVLSLVNAKDGLLLIDEFENGMHHTVQANAWRAIFKLASRLNIQVIATSHSWDAIEAFQKAASESPEDGVLVRLSRKGEDIIPTLFHEDELAVVTRNRIEVR